jgi:hypothetical protein
MWYEDRGKTYANDYYNLKIKEHAALHEFKTLNTGFDPSVTGSHHENSPFIVDWQMSDTEIRVKYESPPVH